jgi:hypothetical protein
MQKLYNIKTETETRNGKYYVKIETKIVGKKLKRNKNKNGL